MNFKGLTDKGIVRSSNQDAYFSGNIAGTPFAVVCDGMGGTSGGNIASGMTVERFEKLSSNPDTRLNDSRSAERFFTSAITSANVLVYNKASEDDTLKGMGTTVVAAAVLNNSIVIAHVGDSRAYYINDNKITQITRDHSLVQSLIESGKITAEEAKTYPHRNMITRAVGVGTDLEIEFDELSYDTGGILLLCTDGLTNMVSDEEILEIITKDFTNAESLLINKANEKGGLDNITAAIIKLGE